jgi:hypothetical protein
MWYFQYVDHTVTQMRPFCCFTLPIARQVYSSSGESSNLFKVLTSFSCVTYLYKLQDVQATSAET